MVIYQGIPYKKNMCIKKSTFKLIKTQDAIGHILAHDMTQIIPGEFKGARFCKGHMVTEEDIPVLLSMGKENLYIWEDIKGTLCEDQAAQYLATLCQGSYMHSTPVKEGKIELIADQEGLLTVDVTSLNAINSLGEILIATRYTNTAVKTKDVLLGARVIPLNIAEGTMKKVEEILKGKPLITITPWELKTAAIVVTGNEVAQGRIKDAFTPIITNKLDKYGIKVIAHQVSTDDIPSIQNAIVKLKEASPDMIFCTGGMSVDPDDQTPIAIENCCQKVVTYGTPVLPGSMFMLGYFEDGVPIMGLPGCVMYHEATILDIVLLRVIAGIPLSREDFVTMGHGGLCLKCERCHFPNCVFGK